MTSPLELLIQNYAARVVDRLKEAKKTADRTGDPFQRGRHGGFYLALTMLLNEAKSCGVDIQATGLEGIDPDDLI